MGRRTFGLSVTQINRMISASRAAAKSRERVELINSQRNISIENEPEYSVVSSDFNKDTRVAHIEFQEAKSYRKIERYVTQDGVRYPVYGGWNTKTKRIKKTIKLTNEALEKLEENDDYLIREFRHYIVGNIVETEDLYPSWFLYDALLDEKNNEILNKKNKCNESKALNTKKIRDDKTKILICKNRIKELEISLAKVEKKHKKISKKLFRAETKGKFDVFLAIVTAGISRIFHSNMRINKLKLVKGRFEKDIEDKKTSIEAYKKDINKSNIEIKTCETIIEELNKLFEKETLEIEKYYSMRINDIEALPVNLGFDDETDFVPLKKLAGMNYEKIVGCYVIRNTEKNKYYVGQSKDVMKRVTKQHFDGTNVKNIIFAEDYFNSAFENKDDLFEVKIIRLETKDELDKKESELIEYYDSFRNGYNATKGNK